MELYSMEQPGKKQQMQTEYPPLSVDGQFSTVAMVLVKTQNQKCGSR